MVEVGPNFAIRFTGKFGHLGTIKGQRGRVVLTPCRVVDLESQRGERTGSAFSFSSVASSSSEYSGCLLICYPFPFAVMCESVLTIVCLIGLPSANVFCVGRC